MTAFYAVLVHEGCRQFCITLTKGKTMYVIEALFAIVGAFVVLGVLVCMLCGRDAGDAAWIALGTIFGGIVAGVAMAILLIALACDRLKNGPPCGAEMHNDR
jgi:hypothetical protein